MFLGHAPRVGAESTRSLSFRILNYPAVVAVPDLEAHEAVRAIFGGFPPHVGSDEDQPRYTLTREERGHWCVRVGGRRTSLSSDLADAVVALEWQVVSDMLHATRGGFHLHGAALLAPSGEASLLVLGASGAGKTTLALALMARGFLPFADDIVFIDPDTLVPRALQRAFHVDASTRALVERSLHRPAIQLDGLPGGYVLPLHWATRDAPVRTIVFPTVRPDELPAATRLTIAEATARLLPFSTTLEEAPQRALSVAARLTARAACYGLVCGDLDITVDLVARL